MATLIIINDPPYGTELAFNAVRLANAINKAQPHEENIVFLMADAVLAAKAGQKTPEGYYNLELMLKRFIRAGGRVLLCGTCMDARALGQDDMIDDDARSTMDELAAATIASDRTLVF